jgi:UDP-N-acetylglucosamine 2-epimerase (non-hydrolysing)
MSKLNILMIAGTRPNFIKLAPLYHRLKKENDIDIKICHTGQHYDKNMSDVFWEYLELPEPNYALGIGGGTVPEVIGNTTVALAKLMQEAAPTYDLVIVFGDVNATVSGAITATQLGIPVMHVEAGLRSFDRSMPEEINRVITDHISEYLMVSEFSGLEHLQKEGIESSKIHFVGNIMIETLINTRSKWESVALPDEVKDFISNPFAVCTFHRPENVDVPSQLEIVARRLLSLSTWMPVVFPVHPRTKARLEKSGLYQLLVENQNIKLLPPLGYFEFLSLVSKSAIVITDSGGIQEETAFLGKPCVTIRKNTERPITITEGTNILMDLHNEDFLSFVQTHQDNLKKAHLNPIKFWDNKVSDRILDVIKQCRVKK